jgi:hypothetical protein
LITIDATGVVRRIKGLAHPWRPSVPKAPNGQLALAYVYQNWRSAIKPNVFNNAIHAIPMSDIEAMRSSINDLYDLIARKRPVIHVYNSLIMNAIIFLNNQAGCQL